MVELKQWSRAHILEDSENVWVLEGMGTRLHPVEQVRRYCNRLRDFAAALSDNTAVGIAGVPYLHNATDLDLEDLWEYPEDEQGRMFTGQRRGEFLTYLSSHLAPTTGADAADLLTGSAVRPNKQLMALAADEVQRREQFALLDEQQIAFSLVMRAVEQSYRANTKEVIVVSGGPGSGKSVIALSQWRIVPPRQDSSPRHRLKRLTQTLRRVAGARAPCVKSMLKYFNQFVDAERNDLDVLICDEAHRIRETSTNRYTPASARSGRAQVSELIDAARLPVFLLDQFQVVRPGEIGSIDDIEAAARAVGLETRLITLDAQFGCGGSRAYEQWVLRLLGLEPGGPAAWEGDDAFSLTVTPAPSLMEASLRTMLDRGPRTADRGPRTADRGYGARIPAAYCWPWSDPIRGVAWSSTSRSVIGTSRGTTRRTPRTQVRPARPSGPATLLALTRSAGSTPRRASSTTMPA